MRLAVLIAVLAACSSPRAPEPPTPAAPISIDARPVTRIDAAAPAASMLAPGDRVAAVDPADGWARLQEEPEHDGECARDADCFIGGCASYACTPVEDLMSECLDAPALAPREASCGCVAGRCIWWRRRDATLPR